MLQIDWGLDFIALVVLWYVLNEIAGRYRPKRQNRDMEELDKLSQILTREFNNNAFLEEKGNELYQSLLDGITLNPDFNLLPDGSKYLGCEQLLARYCRNGVISVLAVEAVDQSQTAGRVPILTVWLDVKGARIVRYELWRKQYADFVPEAITSLAWLVQFFVATWRFPALLANKEIISYHPGVVAKLRQQP